MATNGSSGAQPVKRRRGRIILFTLAGLVVVLIVVVLLAPTIASAIAPGRIESAANASIKGRVEVGAVSVGWFSATSVGPVEVIDPEGKTAASVTVNMPATLGRIVRERWWSAKNLDVGEVALSGVLDLVRDQATGQTNLQRALEPRTAAVKQPAPPPPQGGSGGGIESVKAALKITQLDATVRDKDAAGKLSPEMGVKGLAGTVNLHYAASPMSLAAVADLSGAAVGSSDPLRIKLDSRVKPKPSGGLDSFKVKLDVANAPVGLIDALANQGGALVRAMGAKADVSVDAGGTTKDAAAKLVLVSDGTNANLNLALKDGVLTEVGGAGSGRITLRSTEFLASMPALREALAKAGERVQIDAAPGVEISIEKLRWPVPPEMLEGAAAAGALAKADVRGSGVDLKVRVAGMSGKVAVEQGEGTNWKSFAVEPVELVMSAADLAQGVTVTGGTKATIDGSPAGTVSLRASASDLLDAQGRVRAMGNGPSVADSVNADARVTGMSTALLQPLAAASGLAVDLRTDLGPTLDAEVQARVVELPVQDAADQVKNFPRMVSVTLHVSGANVKVDGTGQYLGGVVSTTGDGLKLDVVSATRLAQRVLAKDGQAPAIALSGTGAVKVTVKDFAAPLDKLKGADALASVKASVSVELSDLGVAPGTDPAEPGSLAQGQPVQVGRATVAVKLDGANPPQVDVSSSMTHEGQPFGLTGQVKLGGITGGKLPQSSPGAGRIVAFKPEGRVEIKDVPRSVLNLLPAAAAYGTAALAATNMPAQVARAVRESIGRNATITLTTQPEGGAQAANVKLTTQAGGVGADVAVKVTDAAVTVSTLQGSAGMDPAVVNPVLAAAGTKGGAAKPIQIAKAFKLTARATEPITVPLKPGTFEPDFAKASEAVVTLSADNEIAVDNVPAGTDAAGAPHTTGVRIALTKADLRAPLAGLAAGAGETGKHRLSAAFAMGMRDGANASIGDISGTLTSTMDFASMATMAPDADVKIASINTAVAEGLIGKPGLLTGALGDKADAALKIKPAQGSTAISAQISAPRLSDAKLDLVQTADRVALTKPATITWRPEAGFLAELLFPPAPAPAPTQKGTAAAPAAQAMSITQVSPVTINLAKFAVAMTKGEGDQQTVGPLKPGVFELDASVSVPTAGLVAAPSAAGGQPTAIAFEGIRAAVKHQAVQGGGGFGELVADLTIDRVTGGAASAGGASAGSKASHANVRVTNLADTRGVPTTKAAIVNLDADLMAFPTAVVDAIAHQNGILAELLGPTMDVRATGRNVSMGPAPGSAGGAGSAKGAVEATLASPRASAEVKGDIRDGVFVQTGPVEVRITEVTPQLVKQLAGAVPVVDSLEKTAKDEAGRLSGRSLTIPLSGDLTKLSGDVEIDPGVARFTTKTIFGEILAAFGQKSAGAVGQRLEPFKVRADRGVLTYERFKLPLGSFIAETRGTVDLVQRRIDVVTYAPLGALTDKALGDLNTGIAGRLGLLDKLTQVPITTKGPMDKPKTELDLGLFVKEQAEALAKAPGKIIEGVLDGLLNKPKPKK